MSISDRTFTRLVTAAVQERLKECYHVCLTIQQELGGFSRYALCIQKIGVQTRPTLYLNAYYDLYEKHMELKDIVDEILEVYEWNEERLKELISDDSSPREPTQEP